MATIALSGIFWITLPVYFTWMYLCNERNAVWFASMTSMFLIYYHLTDWRIATIGTISGILAGAGLFHLAGPPVAPVSSDQVIMHLVVFTFAWYMSLMLGISSSSLRREQIKQALGTMGIMAHELRTPLSTMALISDAVLSEARTAPGHTAQRIEQLTVRLHATVRQMNRQIDMQITNARLMELPRNGDVVSAAQVVRDAVLGFPYRNGVERACVQIDVSRDFSFYASETLFKQVIENLVKNALHSLATLSEAPKSGDLRLEIDSGWPHTRNGRIRVIDRGRGISPDLQARLFQPFVSTQQNTGHGLGLAFCQRVIHTSRGRIQVESEVGCGARFIIDLPSL
jgi:two-component system CAI-1 autoinducer sensor kinase/phosphatase CqsS